MNWKRNILLVLLLAPCLAWAQDIHFSQFYNAPLTINPAHTGLIDGGNLRVVANHRTQWASVTVPYLTTALSFDTRNWTGALKGDAIGLGLSLQHDQAGDGHLTLLHAMANVAYHQHLDIKKEHWLTLGVRGGVFQRSLDVSRLIFGSQWSEIDFKTSIPSGELIANDVVLLPDLQAGIMYNHIKPAKHHWKAGMTFFHLIKPNQTFLQQTDILAFRTLFHGRGRVKVGNQTFMGPDVLLMHQHAAREITLGLGVDHTLASDAIDNITLNMGAWYRASGNDAVILMGGATYKKWQAGLSYDFNVSNLHTASGYRGGFEVAIIYVDNFLRGKGNLPVVVPCLRP